MSRTAPELPAHTTQGGPLIPELLRTLATAEQASGGPDAGKILRQVAKYGVVGMVVVLLIISAIVPNYVMNAPTPEKDDWRTASEQERTAGSS
ncbi:hypothetical protein [Streptomyces sp. NPDC101149]|uniref:hypothetical protein n=1 Tax=Streptomyces sp. NPDC101149 TaxID=3366113 RepID=UPI003825D52D